jgi:tetratricopeptide (TPR) repeat protein
MADSFQSAGTVRDYLLGRVSDEATLEGLEELLFTDAEFCSRVALAEDELINDYVLGYLDEPDAASFRATLAGNPDRRLKLELTEKIRARALAETARPSVKARASEASASDASPRLLDSLAALFRRPLYAGGLALLMVGALASALYFGSGGDADPLAGLRAIYERERPNEARLYGFAYGPLVQLRGEQEQRERSRLRQYENSLLDAAEQSPGAGTHHALGVLYLLKREYADAAREFESALKFDDRSARIHNDLGAAYFGLANGSAKERRLEVLGRALEEFTRASELDPNSLEALFNKSLALQELGLWRRARESWALYLQKDAASPWAEEARRNLARVSEEGARLKTDEGALEEQVLGDFLEAYRRGEGARALKIHDETKGLLRGAAVPLQLSRRYLLATLGGDAGAAKESLGALAFVGDSERARHADFFFLNSRASTRASMPAGPLRCFAQGRCSTPASACCSTPAGAASRATT